MVIWPPQKDPRISYSHTWVLNIANEILEFPAVEISLVYWRYKAMNFSLHYSIKYFKNNNCFLSILNLFFFSVNAKDFQRNVQHSIQMSFITKRNSNVHIILGNTGHAWRGLTVTVA